MKMYQIVTTQSFEKALKGLPINWQKRIVAKIKDVAANPYAPNNNLTKLQGRDGYRLRVGDWRVIFYEENGSIIIVAVGHRREVYD